MLRLWRNMTRAANPPFTLEQGLGWTALWAALDQTAKWAVVHFFRLPPYEAHSVLPFLDFTFVWNTGISYGLFGGNGELGRWLLSGLALAAIGYFLWALRNGETMRVGMAYALLAGGALGNLIDRVWYGAVVDFISLHWAGFYWYVFNPADMWITFAVIILLYDAFLPQKPADCDTQAVADNAGLAIDKGDGKESNNEQ